MVYDYRTYYCTGITQLIIIQQCSKHECTLVNRFVIDDTMFKLLQVCAVNIHIYIISMYNYSHDVRVLYNIIFCVVYITG